MSNNSETFEWSLESAKPYYTEFDILQMVLEIGVYVQYGAGFFWIFGAPLYLITSWAMNTFNFGWTCYTLYLLFDAEVQMYTDYGELDKLEKTHTYINWFLFPWRKNFLYFVLSTVGFPFMMIPVFGWLATLIFGALQWINIALF